MLAIRLLAGQYFPSLQPYKIARYLGAQLFVALAVHVLSAAVITPVASTHDLAPICFACWIP